jgi:hypothetical protein
MLSEHERREVREFLGRLRRDGVDSIFLERNPQMMGDSLSEFSRLSTVLVSSFYGGDQEFNLEDLKLFNEVQAKINNRCIDFLYGTFCDDVNELVFVSKADAKKCADLVRVLNEILCRGENQELQSIIYNLQGPVR